MRCLTSRQRSKFCILLALGVLVAMSDSQATGEDKTGLRIYEEQLRVRLDEQLPGARELGFDAGGWFSYAYFNYTDGALGRTRTLRQSQLRGWASLNVRGVHQAYVRGLLSWDDWNSGDNPISGRGDDFDEELERAWYQFDLGKLMRNQTGKAPPVGFKVKVGRQFMTIGTSLVLSVPLDMIRFDVTTSNWDFLAMGGQTVEDTRNIDDSDRVANHQDRCFYGFQISYKGIPQHRPFAYYLSQSDHTSSSPAHATQEYDYSSRYLGGGSTGSFGLPGLQYQTEFVAQWGKTYGNSAVAGTTRDKIRAMAFDVILEYLFDIPMHPKAGVEYLFATGDSDRSTSATATIGGNRVGTRDNAFNAFGFRDTGIAFSPRISNLHMWAVGGSLFTLESIRLFRKMEVGTKVFFYHKAKAGGPISDTTASNDARNLGWEWDVFCDWRLTSDVAWTIRYGIFQPGSSFDGGDKSSRHFVYTGVVFSF